MRQSWETMTSVSAGHIILTPTQPVGSGRPQRESNPRPPHQESRALPTELLRPPHKRGKDVGTCDKFKSYNKGSKQSLLKIQLFGTKTYVIIGDLCVFSLDVKFLRQLDQKFSVSSIKKREIFETVWKLLFCTLLIVIWTGAPL